MNTKSSYLKLVKNIEGSVSQPLILWFLGVPGGICALLWFFIWRGK
jgi:hypothetical protein